MKITRYMKMTEQELERQLRTVRLRGHGQPLIYEHCKIHIEEAVLIDPVLVPPQRYVLTGTVRDILTLHKEFLRRGEDIFRLRGALFFWLEGMDIATDLPIPLLPPIAEESYEEDGRRVMLLNDGMHRVKAALTVGERINTVFVKDVPREYPYYAYGFEGGWKNIVEFEELPDVFEKKRYRNPENYKALFRQFNNVFPGVQKDRKQSNPAHIKA
jgi:hypothetical protein